MVIVIDTREQTPFEFSSETIRATVPSGADYTVEGFEDSIGIERKSISDLVSSLTVGRDRFMRSIQALKTRKYRALVIEGELSDLAEGHYRSSAPPASIIGSLAALMADGIPVVFGGHPDKAAAFTERLLTKFHKRASAPC